MSGHSKWHNIQKTKGAQDAKRAAAFTKIAKEIIVAVKEGGGITDPANNSRLATVITKAKATNMPNDNIKRVLEKAAGAGSGDNYETITYEGYGPGGVAVIVETMTDNRNRTAGSMRHHFDKYGGNMGASGCVSWSFDRKGVLVIDNEDGDYEEDAVMMDARKIASPSTPLPTTSTPWPTPSPPRAMPLPPPRLRWFPRTIRSWRRKRTSPTWKKCWTSSMTMTTCRTSGTIGSRNK